MPINWNTIDNQRLVQMFMVIRTPKELRTLLDDLISEKYLQTLVKKAKAAHMVELGAPQSRISKETGLSPTTVCKISKRVNEPNNGYALVFKWIYPRGYHCAD